MLEFEFRLCFKTFHVRTLLLKKDKKNEQKVLVSCCFTLFGISEQTYSFVNLVNPSYCDKYSQFITITCKVYEVSKAKVTHFLCLPGYKTRRGRGLQR